MYIGNLEITIWNQEPFDGLINFQLLKIDYFQKSSLKNSPEFGWATFKPSQATEKPWL